MLSAEGAAQITDMAEEVAEEEVAEEEIVEDPKHVRRYKGAYSLMDLEGVHHIDRYERHPRFLPPLGLGGHRTENC